MLLDQTLDLGEIAGSKPDVASQSDRSEPELAGGVVAIHVHMRRLVRFMTEEVYPVGTGAQNRRHVAAAVWRSAAGARGGEGDQVEVVVGKDEARCDRPEGGVVG